MWPVLRMLQRQAQPPAAPPSQVNVTPFAWAVSESEHPDAILRALTYLMLGRGPRHIVRPQLLQAQKEHRAKRTQEDALGSADTPDLVYAPLGARLGASAEEQTDNPRN